MEINAGGIWLRRNLFFSPDTHYDCHPPTPFTFRLRKHATVFFFFNFFIIVFIIIFFICTSVRCDSFIVFVAFFYFSVSSFNPHHLVGGLEMTIIDTKSIWKLWTVDYSCGNPGDVSLWSALDIADPMLAELAKNKCPSLSTNADIFWEIFWIILNKVLRVWDNLVICIAISGMLRGTGNPIASNN